jgi:glycosyltransferase involved in cell wall biosynthesis
LIKEKISVVIPAKNEANSLILLLPKLKTLYPNAEIIVVNDGSTDNTSEICFDCGVREIKHPYSKGNGAAVKTGARAATGDVLVFMDGDGQHRPEDIARLLTKYEEGYHLIVGARSKESQASAWRWMANSLYNGLSSWMVGHNVEDLTSGFRVVNAKKFREFLTLLPNGFSYPTTSTMAFFRAGYSVAYVPIVADAREGKSHINLVKDGVRFLLIIFKVGTLYSPLKLFAPISGGFFGLGVIYYLYTFLSNGRFTNMGVLLFTTAVIVFLIGLVSEQITMLMYSEK